MNEPTSKPESSSVSIIVELTCSFEKDLRMLRKRYRNAQRDLQDEFLSEIQNGSFSGKQVSGNFQGYVVYKARCKNSDAVRGKRGGYRLVYCLNPLENVRQVFLLAFYSKSDQEDILPNEIMELIKIALPVPAQSTTNRYV